MQLKKQKEKEMQIKSTFHQTTATVRPIQTWVSPTWVTNNDFFEALPGTINSRQLKRLQKKLCGMHDCRCGGVARSNASVQWESDGGATLSVEWVVVGRGGSK